MKVLMTLVDIPHKRLSFKELERQLALAQSTTAGLISRLEQKGLVSVTGDKDDKRIKYVEITELGITYCKDAEMDNTERKLVSALSEKERGKFLCLLKKVNETLKNT